MTLHLLHGALGSGSTLLPLQQELQSLGLNSTVHEFPGHGKTALGSTAFSIPGYALWLYNVVKQVESNSEQLPAVFGYSMGGYVALKLEELHPNTFRTVVTLGTKFAWTAENAKKEASRLVPDVIEQKVPAFANMLTTRHEDWRRVVASTAQLMMDIPANNLLQPANIVTSSKAQFVLGRGTEDTMVSEQETREMAEALKAKHVEFGGMPHPIENISVKELAKEIADSVL